LELLDLSIKNKERFHREKDLILSTGLQISKYINVDDTGVRHKGQNGYYTHIGNEYFAWFESTPKRRQGPSVDQYMLIAAINRGSIGPIKKAGSMPSIVLQP